MHTDLEGKTAVVTGAGSGLDEGIARRVILRSARAKRFLPWPIKQEIT